MILVENFYDSINDSIIKNFNFVTVSPRDNRILQSANDLEFSTFGVLSNPKLFYNAVIYYDQEPLETPIVNNLWNPQIFQSFPNRHTIPTPWDSYISGVQNLTVNRHFMPNCIIFANSEHSEDKKQLLKSLNDTYDWYYFYHGFASLHWFNGCIYQNPIHTFSKLFISFNNLFNSKRSYRLNLISEIIANNLRDLSLISLNQNNSKEQINQELFSNKSLLSKNAKKKIYENLLNKTEDLMIDISDIHGSLSAYDQLPSMCQGLFHIVTETVFYDEKLHLTEKIFKPIVARRPFMLVGAPGNLEYFKSYGFRTWDRWIDENYDSESDPDIRIKMIVAEMVKLAKKPQWQIDQMYSEMQENLEYNFYHFYTDFKTIIAEEMVDNFRRCLIQHNAGRDASMINYIDHRHINWSDIKKRLSL